MLVSEKLMQPLRFEPVFRQYIWGGRRLATALGKPLPNDAADFAESWEVVDHGDDQSVVADGEYAGWTLSKLVRERGEALLGRHHPQSKFPLLFKLLDCNRNLSVQVHPNDAQGATLTPPDLGKTEAWVIVAAEPGACLYAGLKAGIGREQVEQAIQSGNTESILHRIEPKVGDCIFIPAGTVHALGAGLLVAEIQQSSNTTFRLFDWNRVDANGNSRPLHIQESLEVTNYESGPVQPQPPEVTDNPNTERLVACDKFILDRRTPSNTGETVGGDNRCHIVSTVNGKVMVGKTELSVGQTILIPASAEAQHLESDEAAQILDMYLP